MLLYYITDRSQFAGDECTRRARLLEKIAEAARAGVDYIQLREKDLDTRILERLAREAVAAVQEANRCKDELETGSGKPHTRLLINSRVDVALAAGADGVHLRSGDLAASDARVVWSRAGESNLRAGSREAGVFAVSCHTVGEVRTAEAHGAGFAVFAPVFEKTTAPVRSGVGLDALREACQAMGFPASVEGVGSGHMPVLALGGITLGNAAACIEAGAAGIAAIRLFQEHDVVDAVLELRAIVRRRS